MVMTSWRLAPGGMSFVVVVVVVTIFGMAAGAGENIGAADERGEEEGRSRGSVATKSVWNCPPL